jgi:glycosyltransferase involved in cell wall biosynthesis
MSDIMVSVCMLSYNHEKFIRKAIEGVLAQKTNFKFELLIHDDASTDKSAEIIRKYEEKYPDIVKPIYQTENQYSQGVKINSKYQYSRAQGKYIALCEGDDFWCDSNKLQQQFNAKKKTAIAVYAYTE